MTFAEKLLKFFQQKNKVGTARGQKSRTMVASINSTTTKTTGWQKKCWEWAEAHIPFEIRDVEAEHFMFCQELCAEYHYTYKYRCQQNESVAKFKPKE